MEKGLVGFFEQYLEHSTLFATKEVLQANYMPPTIPHREAFITACARLLAPALRRQKPSNLFVYGHPGTGKTLVLSHVAEQLERVADDRGLPVKTIMLNCKLKKLADTEYRVLAQLCRELGTPVPPTGLPTDEVFALFQRAVDARRGILILVLDEIDQLVSRAGDDVLYTLTRINAELKHSQICLVGISNDLLFTEGLDPRVKSSLGEEDLLFPPYDAMQIQTILAERAKQAFKSDVIEAGVIEKCAAIAAQQGDARRAIELLRVAGELAEREGGATVSVAHVDAAQTKLERDRVLELVQYQPPQYRLCLLATLSRKSPMFTGEVYESYLEICRSAGTRPLTQRRIGDILSEYDMLGVLHAKVISKGRYGRTREIAPAIPTALANRIKKLVAQEFGL